MPERILDVWTEKTIAYLFLSISIINIYYQYSALLTTKYH